jgi:cell division protease FtsH
MVMSEEEKKLTAYHEAGHAIVGMHMPGHDPLHKVTIIPRGRALGLTMSLPERDRLSSNREWCRANLASAFGGREAELLIFGPDKVTNGATGDIQQATRLARAMVTEWGMSERLGRVRYNGNEQEIFLGHSVAQSRNISEATANLIDQEVRELIEEGEQTARRLLREYQGDLHTLANALLEYETLSSEEVHAVLRGEKLDRPDDSASTPLPPTPALPVTDDEDEPVRGGAWPDPAPA